MRVLLSTGGRQNFEERITKDRGQKVQSPMTKVRKVPSSCIRGPAWRIGRLDWLSAMPSAENAEDYGEKHYDGTSEESDWPQEVSYKTRRSNGVHAVRAYKQQRPEPRNNSEP